MTELTMTLAVQNNLETLINRARSNPLSQRRLSDADPEHPTGSNARFYERDYAVAHPHGRPSTIREVSYDEGAIFLDDDQDDEEGGGGRDERSGLLASQPASRRQSLTPSQTRGRRSSYGTMSEPLKDPHAQHAQGRGSVSSTGAKAGTSRSRSKVRSPPRKSRGEEDGPGGGMADDRRSVRSHRSTQSRGRDMEERPLSPLMAMTKARRESIASWFGDDSSGDEGGDVARGLLAGGGSMLGANHSAGFGLGAQGMVANGMEYDPAEELTYDDLELPVNDEGYEVRVWSDAMKVSLVVGVQSSLCLVSERAEKFLRSLTPRSQAEIPIILRLSLPVFFTQLAEWSLVLASVISIGHLGTTELAAASYVPPLHSHRLSFGADQSTDWHL